MAHLLVIDSSKEDLFVCGDCKMAFTFLPAFLEHKRQMCNNEVAAGCRLIASNENTNVSELIPTEHCDFKSSTSDLTKPIKNAYDIIAEPSASAAASSDNCDQDICCKLCKKHFKKLKTLLVHLKTHNGKPYQCVICGRCFSQNAHLQRHEMSHRVWPEGLSETTPKTTEVDALSYSCNYCDKVLSNYSQFRAHLKNHNQLKKFKCVQGECIILLDSMEQLLHHVASNHPSPLYTCHLCNEAFTNLQDISVHQQNHNDLQKPPDSKILFKCAKCDATFKRKDRLYLHMSIENHRKVCVHCNKTFASDKRLRLHLQIHRNIKPFQCSICSQSFHMKKYLAAHILKHGERQFTCKLCNNKFKRQDLLQRHMKSHQNKKMFKCPFKETLGCTMEFTRNDKLNLHVKHHTKQITGTKNRLPKEDAASTMEILIVPLCDTENVKD